MLLHLAYRAFFHAEGERGSTESRGGVGNLLDDFLRFRPARKSGVGGELLHGFQRRCFAVAAERGHVFAARVRAECRVVERRRLPVAAVVLQERPVFAVVVVIGKEQIEDGARKLEPPDGRCAAELLAHFQQVAVIEAGQTVIGMKQAAGAVQVIAALRGAIEALEGEPALGAAFRWCIQQAPGAGLQPGAFG